MAYLYRHIRLDKNEPFYIGIATHLKRAYEKGHRNHLWKSIASKTNHIVEILFDDLTREQALEKEKEFVSLYGRIDKKTGTLANLTDGGEDFTGCWNKGKKRTEEQKAKLREAAKHKPPFTEERKLNISKALKGKTKSPEHILKVSNSLKGKSNGKWTKDHKYANEQYWLSIYEPIGQFDLNDNLIKVWYNRRYIYKEINAKPSCITQCLKNYKATHKKHKWKLLDTNLPFSNPQLSLQTKTNENEVQTTTTISAEH
jgi:hypothetical protein